MVQTRGSGKGFDPSAVGEDLKPLQDAVQNLGSQSKRWAYVFASIAILTSVVIGSAIQLSETGGWLFINASTRVNGSMVVQEDLTVNGTLLYADSSNSRVGIGTDNPLKLLHVSGDARVDGNLQTIGNITTVNVTDLLVNGSITPYPGLDDFFVIGNASARWSSIRIGTGDSVFDGDVIFNNSWVNGTSVNATFTVQAKDLLANDWANVSKLNVSSGLIVTPSGNVGIGTTSPGAVLDIRTGADRAIYIDNSPSATGYNTISLNAILTEGNYVGITGGGTGDDDLYVNAGNAGDMFFRTGNGLVFSTKATILNSGNVGIGTTTPTRLLDLGTTFGTSIGAAAAKKIAIYQDPTNFYGLGVSNVAGVGYLEFHAESADTEAPGMLLTSTGKVGIGTTSPVKKLDVVGDINATGNMTAQNVFLPAYIFAHVDTTIPVASGGTWYNITFNDTDETKERITHPPTTSANDTFTIVDAGTYRITYTMSFEDSAASPDAHIVTRVVRNGVEINGSLLETDTSKQNADTLISHSTLLAKLAVNDAIKFQFTADDTTISLASHKTYGVHKDTAVITLMRVA